MTVTITERFREQFGASALEELLIGLGRHWDEAFMVEKADPDVKLLCALVELYAWDCSTKCTHRPKLTESELRAFLKAARKTWLQRGLQVPLVGIKAWSEHKFDFLNENGDGKK